MKSNCNNNSIQASYHVVEGHVSMLQFYGTVTITLTGNPVIDTDNCKNAIEIKCKL